MSSGRFPFSLALAACLACGAAWAEGEGTSWTDPPARTAPQEPVKPPETKPPEPARTERPPEPATGEPTQARQSQPVPTQAAPTQAAPTQAERRQEQIRRAVARSTAEREAEAAARTARTPRRRLVERPAPPRHMVERPLRMSERPAPYLRESRVARPRSLRRTVYGYADPIPAHGRYEADPQAWDEGPDDRASRIGQARSAGYLVVRSRSYAYPDGTVVRRLSPIGGYDYDD